jgi:hypothetical protein
LATKKHKIRIGKGGGKAVKNLATKGTKITKVNRKSRAAQARMRCDVPECLAIMAA